MTTHSHGARSLCGPDCAYKRLYEGSQTSLSAMAARQTEALGRVASLRAGVIEVLKQAFPTQFSAAEAQLGRRMQLVDDEILMAFLRGFVATSAQPTAPAGADALRDALARQGIAVPTGYDLAAWAAAVSAAPAVAPTGPVVATTPSSAAAAVAPVARSSFSDAPPPPADNGSGQTSWEDPYDDVPAPEFEADGSGFASVFDDDSAAASSQVWGQLFADESTTPVVAPDMDPDELVDSLFEKSSTSTPVAAEAPAAEPTRAKSKSRRRGRNKAAAPADVEAAPPARRPSPFDDDVPAPFEDAPPPIEDLPPVPVDLAAAASPEPAAPLTAQEPSPAPADDVTVAAPPRTAAQAFKPELFPSGAAPKTGRRTPKTIRVTPTRPSARTDLDVPVAETGQDVGSADDFAKLREAVGKPRPVFTLDLIESTGSHELVASWERHERSDSASPVRFIGGSSRHQRRGPLVVPYAPELRQQIADAGPSLWWDLIDEREGRTRLRGNFLYEAAVLAVRFGHEVVDHKVEPNLITLLLNSPGTGMRALVFWTGSQPPAGDDLTAVADAIELRLGARLGMIAVLTAIAGEKPLEKIVAALSAEAASRGWKPTMPIVATHAWEFARDGGASAHQIA